MDLLFEIYLDIQFLVQREIFLKIQDVALKTYRERWTIEKSGGRGWHDDAE